MDTITTATMEVVAAQSTAFPCGRITAAPATPVTIVRRESALATVVTDIAVTVDSGVRISDIPATDPEYPSGSDVDSVTAGLVQALGLDGRPISVAHRIVHQANLWGGKPRNKEYGTRQRRRGGFETDIVTMIQIISRGTRQEFRRSLIRPKFLCDVATGLRQ